MPNDNKVIAVFSPIGGIGVSTIAVHLAYLLARKSESAIMDLVLDFGSVAEFLDFAPKYRVDQIPVDSITTASPVLSQLSFPRRQTLKVFAAPEVLPQKFNLTELIRSCRRSFQYTVMDLPHTLLVPEVEAALEEADYVILVCLYGWETICLVDIFLEDIAKDRMRRNWFNKCKLVINKAEWLPNDVLDLCHQQLKAPIFAKLPLDTKVDGFREIASSARTLFNDLEQLVRQIEMLP